MLYLKSRDLISTYSGGDPGLDATVALSDLTGEKGYCDDQNYV